MGLHCKYMHTWNDLLWSFDYLIGKSMTLILHTFQLYGQCSPVCQTFLWKWRNTVWDCAHISDHSLRSTFKISLPLRRTLTCFWSISLLMWKDYRRCAVVVYWNMIGSHSQCATRVWKGAFGKSLKKYTLLKNILNIWVVFPKWRGIHLCTYEF